MKIKIGIIKFCIFAAVVAGATAYYAMEERRQLSSHPAKHPSRKISKEPLDPPKDPPISLDHDHAEIEPPPARQPRTKPIPPNEPPTIIESQVELPPSEVVDDSEDQGDPLHLESDQGYDDVSDHRNRSRDDSDRDRGRNSSPESEQPTEPESEKTPESKIDKSSPTTEKSDIPVNGIKPEAELTDVAIEPDPIAKNLQEIENMTDPESQKAAYSELFDYVITKDPGRLTDPEMGYFMLEKLVNDNDYNKARDTYNIMIQNGTISGDEDNGCLRASVEQLNKSPLEKFLYSRRCEKQKK